MKKKLLLVFLTIILVSTAFVLVGCGGVEPRFYQIEFDSNGGGQVESITVKEGENIYLSAPYKRGYNFAGWYYGETKVESGTTWNIHEEDLSITLTAMWTAKSYNVSFDKNGGVGNIEDKIAIFNQQFYLPTVEPVKVGYIFDGWLHQSGKIIDGNVWQINENDLSILLIAQWTARDDIPYKVEYYHQNIENDGYTKVETENKVGITDDVASAEIKEYAHFTYNEEMSTTTGQVDAYGNLVLSVYYTRNEYEIFTNVKDEKGGTVNDGGIYRYGEVVSLIASTKVGYNFDGWYRDGQKISSDLTHNITVDESETYTAQWTARDDIPYKVEYYQEDLNGAYIQVENQSGIGVTDDEAFAEIKTYEGFQYNSGLSVASGNVQGDGALVLKIYYNRKEYTVSVNNPTRANISNSGTYKYGTQIETTITDIALGYRFNGWRKGGEIVSNSETYSFTIEDDIVAVVDIKNEMLNFNFSSSPQLCTILGVKDKTVTTINVPNYVTAINEGAFNGCSYLENLTIPFVGNTRKTCSELYQYPLGYMFGRDRYENSEQTAQYYYKTSTSNTTLGYYYIPTSLKFIEVTDWDINVGAFNGCENITEVIIGNKAKIIGDFAFSGCKKLTNVVIGENIETIGSEAFLNCDELEMVTIPDEVITISYKAFSNCDKLQTVNMGHSVETIGQFAFNSELLTKFTLPASLKTIEGNIFSSTNNNVKGIYFEGTIDQWAQIEFADYNSNPICGISLYVDDKLVTEANIENAEKISDYAFYGYEKLTKIVIGDSVKAIGKDAFRACKYVTKIVIGNGVKNIDEYAFTGMSNLESIFYEGTEEDWLNISIMDHNTSITSVGEYTNRTRYYYSETEPTTSGNYWHYVNGVVTKW